MSEQDLGNTQFFKVEVEPETGVKKVLSVVYDALLEKGYNPVNQIVGYIMLSTLLMIFLRISASDRAGFQVCLS